MCSVMGYGVTRSHLWVLRYINQGSSCFTWDVDKNAPSYSQKLVLTDLVCIGYNLWDGDPKSHLYLSISQKLKSCVCNTGLVTLKGNYVLKLHACKYFVSASQFLLNTYLFKFSVLFNSWILIWLYLLKK